MRPLTKNEAIFLVEFLMDNIQYENDNPKWVKSAKRIVTKLTVNHNLKLKHETTR